jgi:hypothetical protein
MNKAGNHLSEDELAFAYNVIMGYAERPYLELSTFDKDNIYMQISRWFNQERETIKKQEMSRLPHEAIDFLRLIYFGTDEEIEYFKNIKYNTFSKPKIRKFFKERGANKYRIQFIFKRMKEYTNIL